jgi:hypothetical protein
MGRVAVAPENKTGEGTAGFPSVKLTEKGQKARFTVIEEPWREFVHYIKHPKFHDDGTPKKEKKRRKNGDEYDDYDLELLRTEICLGDEDTLREKGIDERNCPACDASVKSGGDIAGPVQRFAVNVVYYTLAGNSFNTAKPFSASIKMWKFTGRIYDEIEGIQQEIGDLRRHDITLECEEPSWQRNKLAFKMDPGYKEAPAGYLKELLGTAGNRATDAQLKDGCGSAVPRERMQEDCEFAMRQWRKLRNEGQVSEAFQSKAADLSGGIEELLGEETQDAGTVLDAMTDEQKAALGSAVADPFAEFLPDSPQAAPKKASASTKKPATPRTARPSDAAGLVAGVEREQEAAQQAEKARKVLDDPFGDESESAAGSAPASAPSSTPSPETASSSGDFDFDNLLDGV